MWVSTDRFFQFKYKHVVFILFLIDWVNRNNKKNYDIISTRKFCLYVFLKIACFYRHEILIFDIYIVVLRHSIGFLYPTEINFYKKIYSIIKLKLITNIAVQLIGLFSFRNKFLEKIIKIWIFNNIFITHNMQKLI